MRPVVNWLREHICKVCGSACQPCVLVHISANTAWNLLKFGLLESLWLSTYWNTRTRSNWIDLDLLRSQNYPIKGAVRAELNLSAYTSRSLLPIGRISADICLYRQIFLSIGRYRVYLPIQGLSADNRLISVSVSVNIGIGRYYQQIWSVSADSGPIGR